MNHGITLVLLAVAPLATVPADMTYSQGADVTLSCTAMGGPSNRFQWFLNDMSLPSENSLSLTLLNVSVADGGAYTCMVTNAAGADNATTFVFISPYFTSHPQGMGGANGTMVTLTCGAEAFPAPTYQWGRVDGGTIRPEVTGQDSAMLIFNPLTFGDEGDYICTAMSNGNQVQSQTATLTGNNIISTLATSIINIQWSRNREASTAIPPNIDLAVWAGA